MCLCFFTHTAAASAFTSYNDPVFQSFRHVDFTLSRILAKNRNALPFNYIVQLKNLLYVTHSRVTQQLSPVHRVGLAVASEVTQSLPSRSGAWLSRSPGIHPAHMI